MKLRARSLLKCIMYAGMLAVVPSCSVVYNIPDITDHRIFPSRDINHDPEKEIHYSSFNCQLLALILEQSTGCSLSTYLQEKIWKKIGMQYDATWSTDRKGNGSIEKAFSCLNCTAIDLAKLGRLYLNGGTWEGEDVLPSSFTAEAVKRDTICGSSWCYQYNFRRGPEKYQSYFSRGLYGQLLYIYPENNIVIVRLGKSDLGYQPDFINRNIIEILDQL